MNLIFSADENWGIGKDNQLLYTIAPDMRNFKEKTIGGAVIMGRKTLDSLPEGKPLKDRINIVVTRNPAAVDAAHQETVSGTDRRLYLCENLGELASCLRILALPPDRVWVIGGAEIIQLLLPYSKQAHITRILSCTSDADCRTENFDEMAGWAKTEHGVIQEHDGLFFHFDRYENNFVKELPEVAINS